MGVKKKRIKLFETKYFGFIIGIGIIALMLLFDAVTVIPEGLEMKVLDSYFNLRLFRQSSSATEGVTEIVANPEIHSDIVIFGIDNASLAKLGRWPFPRYRHANLLDTLARVSDQTERERAIFLDIFFIEPNEKAVEDAILIESIRANGRTYLETVLAPNEPPVGQEEDFFSRQDALYARAGEFSNVTGTIEMLPPYYGLEPPLLPYAEATYGYGHANFQADEADKIYRRQPLIAKSSKMIDMFTLEDLTPEYVVDTAAYERLVWFDTAGAEHGIPLPVTAESLKTLRVQMEQFAPKLIDPENPDAPPIYVIRKYKDHFVPAITLSLALSYLNKRLDEVEVVIGSHIRIPSPMQYDVTTDQWVPYKVMITPPVYKDGQEVEAGLYKVMDEIRIPIDQYGEMLVNFMGPGSDPGNAAFQTFPVRSYQAYASRAPGSDPASWPPTRGLQNKIIMVGPFSKGMADDEKPTPVGLMYGVEIHANALNTILMNKFITFTPSWMALLVLCVVILLVVTVASRAPTVLSLIVTLLTLPVLYVITAVVFFSSNSVLPFSLPAIGTVLAFLSIVVYRIMTEEKDKQRIKGMFGNYVSPTVVDHLIESSAIPELGGVDKELTVFFSDIRGFTTLSESMTPQELVNHLNVYLTAMTDIIILYNGTLDKYVGDEVMCFWGAPLPQEDHAILACKCALKQIEVLNQLNSSWPPEKRISIGIGLNSGIMTVGNMGSPRRMNYTLMGDNVNLGARLEGTNKEYKTTIIISEYTYGLVKDRVIARELDNIRVKGKNRPVIIYELLDIPEGLDP